MVQNYIGYGGGARQIQVEPVAGSVPCVKMEGSTSHAIAQQPMNTKKSARGIAALETLAQKLSRPESLEPVLSAGHAQTPLPSQAVIAEVLSELKAVLFPGYFTEGTFHAAGLSEEICARLQKVQMLLAGEIFRGMAFARAGESFEASELRKKAYDIAYAFTEELPEIRRMLFEDARAAYEGDPAATSVGETIFCYPSMLTMIHHRIAHCLYALGVPIIPRMMSEMAHAATGIDIHPGASIAENFFIDHGTGVVIGETCVIGKGCRLYQGVTLGALSFAKNADGTLVKGVARHPILEDGVTVYAGASILGRITIGKGSVIGGNVWLTHDVPAGSKIVQNSARQKPESQLMGKVAQKAR